MATTAKIIINDPDIKNIAIYKHYDGYPSATLPWLLEFHKDFMKNRGWDPEYELAQLLRSSVRLAKKYSLDDSKYTGWGIVNEHSVQTDYQYILDKDKIKIYKFDWELGDYILVEEIDINKIDVDDIIIEKL